MMRTVVESAQPSSVGGCLARLLEDSSSTGLLPGYVPGCLTTLLHDSSTEFPVIISHNFSFDTCSGLRLYTTLGTSPFSPPSPSPLFIKSRAMT